MSNFSDAGRPGGTALAGRAPANTARVMLGSGRGVAGVLHKVPWRAGEDGHCESGRSARSERDVVAGYPPVSAIRGRGHRTNEDYLERGSNSSSHVFFLLSRCVLFKGCVTGTLPRAHLCCQVPAMGAGRTDVGNRVTASCSRRLPSHPESFHTAMVRLVCSHERRFPSL